MEIRGFAELKKQIRLDTIDELRRRIEAQPHEAPCAWAKPTNKSIAGVPCTCWRGHTIDMLQAERQDTERLETAPDSPTPQ